MRYAKIARVLVGELTEEIVKVLLRNRQPDLYYSLEKKIIEAMDVAYKEGYETARREVTDAVTAFDEEKDRLGS